MSTAQITSTAARQAAASKVRPTGAKKYVTWGALALMTTGSVASLRSAPTMAVFGLASVFLYVIPAIAFFIPTSLASAELASGWKGGVYNWVTEAMSAPLGLLAIWCQFAMTIFYYPALLAYVASTIAYIIDPSLANSGVYTAAIIVILYWGSVLVSSHGVKLIAKLASDGTVIGTLIPGAILVTMGIVYLLQGNHSAAPMDAHHILPAWTGLAGLVLIVNNFLAYSGMEMNAVHVDEMKEPAHEYPKSIFVSMALVLAIFILPALVISWVVPSAQISLTAGVMQAFSAFFAHFNLNFLVPLTALAMVVAMLSGMMAWLAGPSKGLLKIGQEYGYLPPRFQKVNEEGIQMNILIGQGIVVSIIGLLYAFIPSVSSAYWIFSVMTTQVYLIMYVLLFAAAYLLRRNQPDHPRGYKAPALTLTCIVGGVASVLAFLIGFVPPSQFSHSSPVLYAVLILAGILLLGVVPPLLLYRLRKPSWKLTPATATSGGAHSAATAADPAAVKAPSGSSAASGGSDTNGASAPAPAVAAGPSKPEPTHSRHRAWSWGIGILVAALAITGVIVYKHGKETALARKRADEVVTLFAIHHLTVPVDHKTLIDVLGTDGGPVCADPNGALVRGLQDQQAANGAATVGSRPIRVDRQEFYGEELVVEVYCPQKLAALHTFVNGKAYYKVIRK